MSHLKMLTCEFHFWTFSAKSNSAISWLEHVYISMMSQMTYSVTCDLIWFLVLNATFSNFSAISWRPVLVVEVPGENHRPWANNWWTLSLAAASRVHPYCNLQSLARTHTVLVIAWGLKITCCHPITCSLF